MWLRLTLNPILPKLVSDNRQLPVFETEKSEFEKVSEWDTTIQDTMEEYDNVER